MTGVEEEMIIFLDESGSECQYKVDSNILDQITEMGGTLMECQIQNTTIYEVHKVVEDKTDN